MQLIADKCKDGWHVVIVKNYCVRREMDILQLIKDHNLQKYKKTETKNKEGEVVKIFIED